jgi:prepilin-type N-terminal cleavage/methylation domain-containing protein
MNTDLCRRSDQGGFTLVELLIAMLLFGIIGSVVTAGIVTSLQSAAATSARIDAVQELELAMQQIARDLRAADPLLTVPGAYESRLGASIQRDGSTRDVYYGIVPTDSADPAGERQLVRDDSGRALVTSIDNGDAADPVFTYLDRFGEPIECTTDCAEQYFLTRQVQIRLVRVIENSTPAVVETRVSVRNLRHGEDS